MEFLELIRGLRDNTHLGFINYETSKTLSCFGAFLAIGLEQNEKCVFLVYDTPLEEMECCLKKYGVDMQYYINKGQLMIMQAIDLYLEEGIFEAEKVLQAFEEIFNEGQVQGYSKLRILTEFGWLNDMELFDRVLDYEVEVERIIHGSPFVAMCQYKVDKCSNDMLKRILTTHRNVFCDNGNSISFFKSNELLNSENTVRFLHESLRDRAELNRACRHLGLINNLTSHILYQEGPKQAADKALAYFAREYWSDVALTIFIDKETKRVLFVSCVGLEMDNVINLIAGPLLKNLCDCADQTYPNVSQNIKTNVLGDLWVQNDIQHLATIPMKNGRSTLGITFLGWKSDQEAQKADLELINYFLNTLSMALDVHYIQDKTYQRKKDAEKLEALGTLTSGIAHEFNNILAVIMGNCQLLQYKIEDPSLSKYISEVATAAQDAANVVRRIQNYSRPKVTYERKGVQLNNIVISAVEFTRTKWFNEAVANGLRFSIDTRLHATKMVAGNESELREVMVNLILNAVDSMPEGGTITVTTEDMEDRVMFSIADAGVGMTPEEAERAFDPFYSTKYERGTGLGLTISRNIILAHNGEISLESIKKDGTTFTIVLPEAKVCGAVRENTESFDCRPLKIIVVDDDELVLRSVSNQLSTLGHEVISFSKPVDLLDRIREGEDADMIITDLAMPGINGMVLAQKVNEIDKNLPVILMTGWFDGFRNFLDRGTVAGILYKPFTLYDLQKQIEEVKMLVS